MIGTSPVEAVRPLLAESEIPLIAPATQSGTMSDMSRPAAEYIFLRIQGMIFKRVF